MTARTVSATIPTTMADMVTVATGRLRGWRLMRRSIKGSKKSKRMARPGMIAVPTSSVFPGKNFSISKRNRKYHSGRGT